MEKLMRARDSYGDYRDYGVYETLGNSYGSVKGDVAKLVAVASAAGGDAVAVLDAMAREFAPKPGRVSGNVFEDYHDGKLSAQLTAAARAIERRRAEDESKRKVNATQTSGAARTLDLARLKVRSPGLGPSEVAKRLNKAGLTTESRERPLVADTLEYQIKVAMRDQRTDSPYYVLGEARRARGDRRFPRDLVETMVAELGAKHAEEYAKARDSERAESERRRGVTGDLD